MTTTKCPDWCTDHHYRVDQTDEDHHEMRVRDELGLSIVIAQYADDTAPVLNVEVGGQQDTTPTRYLI